MCTQNLGRLRCLTMPCSCCNVAWGQYCASQTAWRSVRVISGDELPQATSSPPLSSSLRALSVPAQASSSCCERPKPSAALKGLLSVLHPPRRTCRAGAASCAAPGWLIAADVTPKQCRAARQSYKGDALPGRPRNKNRNERVICTRSTSLCSVSRPVLRRVSSSFSSVEDERLRVEQSGRRVWFVLFFSFREPREPPRLFQGRQLPLRGGSARSNSSCCWSRDE